MFCLFQLFATRDWLSGKRKIDFWSTSDGAILSEISHDARVS